MIYGYGRHSKAKSHPFPENATPIDVRRLEEEHRKKDAASQEEQCRKRAETIEGEWGGFFYDVISGKKRFIERPEAKKLLKVLREGDSLIVNTLDRLGRSLKDMLHTLDMLVNRQVSVYVLKFAGGKPIDITTAIGKLMVHIMLAFAEFEWELCSERTKEALRWRKESGLPYHGGPKFGFSRLRDKVVPGRRLPMVRYIPHEGERTTIRRIYDEHVNRGRSFTQLAGDLQGVLTAEGGKWGRARCYNAYQYYRAMLFANGMSENWEWEYLSRCGKYQRKQRAKRA